MTKTKEEKTKEKILKFVGKQHIAPNINEISEELEITRQTTSTYVKILLAEKKIITKRQGNSILVFLK